MEKSRAEIHNKSCPKFKIPSMLEKIKKISIKMCFIGVEPKNSPTAGPFEQKLRGSYILYFFNAFYTKK
jgi:predicted secreted protein